MILRTSSWCRLFDCRVLLTVGTDAPTAWIVPGASLHSERELVSDDIRNTRAIELVIARGDRYDPVRLLKPIPVSSRAAR